MTKKERQEAIALGEYIYRRSLAQRSGFDLDIDEEIWEEIYEDIGTTALEAIAAGKHRA